MSEQSERTTLTIDLSPEKRQEIAARAQRRGFDTPEAYVLALVEEDRDDDELDEAALIEGFRESWHQAMTGDTRPVSELRDALNDD